MLQPSPPTQCEALASAATCAEHKLSIPLQATSPDKGGFSVGVQPEAACRLQRAQWLRAAILGANDGLLSTTALMLGVSAASNNRWSVILSGLAGAIAGACSMAVGEFVSVATQRDIEKANSMQLQLKDSNGEHDHHIHPLPQAALGTAPRQPEEDEKGQRKERGDQDDGGELIEVVANPYNAALASGLSFVLGAAVPLVLAIFAVNVVVRNILLPAGAVMALALFGSLSAYLGGSPVPVSALRVMIGGSLGMVITYGSMKLVEKI